jgi:hypothetical protein
MRTKDLTKFILERENIRLKKEAGKPRPWTKDEILHTYRFCNVHREDDKVTRWIAKNWREPYSDFVDLWFAMVFARLFNLPSTLQHFSPLRLLRWDVEDVCSVLEALREKGPIFNGAYIVSTNGYKMDKVEYLVNRVLTPLWVARRRLRPTRDDTLASYHARLIEFDGLGSFMAGQVVADLKYIDPLYQAPDWWTWAASGPGSRRGLNRVCEHAVDEPWREPQWLMALTQLRAQVGGTALHAQDLQNCLCEFDKYERVRLGEGRPKQVYKPC